MRISRYIASVLFVFVMFLVAQISGTDMIIFPEMLALLIGMLCTDRVPWKTDALHTVLLMVIAAFLGTAIVKLAPFPVYVQALIGLVVTGLIIILTNCTIMPCVAACLFPIYFKESSLLYPVIVVIMTSVVIVLRSWFVKSGKLEESLHFRYLPDFEEELKLWGFIIVAYAILAALPLFSGFIFFIAPPLVVTLVEGSYKRLAKMRVKIWFVITVASVIGVLMRYAGVDILGLPMCIAAAAATALVLLEMRLMNMMFPPSGAVALLAFIVEGNTFLYPPMISAGAAIILFISALINERAEV